MKSLLQTAGGAGLGLIPALVLSACGPDQERGASGSGSGVRLAPVEVLEVTAAEGYPVQERFVGMVEARRRSDLAFELAGTVVEVAVEEGEFASGGTVLARMDTSRLEARREELVAALAQAVAARDLAIKVRERRERLVARGGVSRQDLEEAVAEGAAAEAAVAQIEAQLRSVEVDLEKSVLRAPYDGTAARRYLDEGTVVSPNALVLAWLEAGELEIRVGMASDAAAALRPGAMVEVISPAGAEFALAVRRILPQRDRATRTVDVILAGPTEEAALRDGDLVAALRRELIAERDSSFPAMPSRGASADCGLVM